MKKALLAAIAAISIAPAAFAADMRPPVLKAPPAPPMTVFSWTGCYIGAYGGGAWGGSIDTNDPRSQGGAFPAGTFYNGAANAGNGGAYSYDLGSSAIAGGTLGCNWQT